MKNRNRPTSKRPFEGPGRAAAAVVLLAAFASGCMRPLALQDEYFSSASRSIRDHQCGDAPDGPAPPGAPGGAARVPAPGCAPPPPRPGRISGRWPPARRSSGPAPPPSQSPGRCPRTARRRTRIGDGWKTGFGSCRTPPSPPLPSATAELRVGPPADIARTMAAPPGKLHAWGFAADAETERALRTGLAGARGEGPSRAPGRRPADPRRRAVPSPRVRRPRWGPRASGSGAGAGRGLCVRHNPGRARLRRHGTTHAIRCSGTGSATTWSSRSRPGPCVRRAPRRWRIGPSAAICGARGVVLRQRRRGRLHHDGRHRRGGRRRRAHRHGGRFSTLSRAGSRRASASSRGAISPDCSPPSTPGSTPGPRRGRTRAPFLATHAIPALPFRGVSSKR